MTKVRQIALVGTIGIARYSTEMFNRIKGHDISTTAFMYGSIGPLGPAISFPFYSFRTDFSGFDIVHDLAGYPFAPRLSSRQIRISTAHELQPVLFPQYQKILRTSIKAHIWQKATANPAIRSMLKADYVLANSGITRKGVIKAGFPKGRIFLTPLGIDERFIKTPLKKPKNKIFKIGTIGTLSIHKNTFFSIDSVKKIHDNVEFELWGKAVYSMSEISDRIGKDKRIKVMGFAPEGKFVDVYDSFDVFVYPSLFEGFGIPIIEAKARGLPVILYKHGHYDDDIKKYCFEAEDEEDMANIILNIKKNGYNEKLRKKAIEHARTFTWERTAKETMKAYEKMR